MTTWPRLGTEWDAFTRLPREQLITSLRAIIDDVYQDAQPVDFDRLMSAGLRLSPSSLPIAEFARMLIYWVHAVPNERRLGIAAALLNGLWKNPRQAPMVFEDDLLEYLDLIEAIPIALEVDNVRQTLEAVLSHAGRKLEARVRGLALRLDQARA